MTDQALDALRWQFDMTWKLAGAWHLPGLTDDMCLWEPAPHAWTVRLKDGAWTPDWADAEPDPVPTTSIAWIGWHLAWWWSEALARAEGSPSPGRDGVRWPGSAEAMRDQLAGLAARWRALLDGLEAEALTRPSTFPWSEPRPLAMTVAWVNAELMKNVAEIGAVRRLYLARRP
jgi:hypothetical protein